MFMKTFAFNLKISITLKYSMTSQMSYWFTHFTFNVSNLNNYLNDSY